jgi:tetratricopeptide (TPR) repeat protein
VGEFLAEDLLRELRANGRRGMALVPRERASLLEGLELPDASLYDMHYHLPRALVRHDRDAADALREQLLACAPDHPVTLRARRSLANYDGDQVEMLACAEQMLALFPENQEALLLKLSCLRDLARREERLALLEEILSPGGETGSLSASERAGGEVRGGAHPVFLQQLAQELGPDAREAPRAIRCLRRAIHARAKPTGGTSSSLRGSSGERAASRRGWRFTALPPVSTTRTRRYRRATSLPPGISSRQKRRCSS